MGLCSERSWGPIIGLGHVLGMSTIQASMYPQVTHKSNMVQLTFIGPNGCFLHNITENSNPKW